MREQEVTFSEFQDAQLEWLRQRNLDTSIQTQAEKLAEEVPEMMEALAILQSDYSSQHEREFAEEIIDVIIVGMGLIAEMGLNAQDILVQKYEKNCLKYDLVGLRELQRQGLTPQEAMRETKRQWENEQLNYPKSPTLLKNGDPGQEQQR